MHKVTREDHEKFDAIRRSNKLMSEDPRCLHCGEKVVVEQCSIIRGGFTYICNEEGCVSALGYSMRNLNEVFAGDHETIEKARLVVKAKLNVENQHKKAHAQKYAKKIIKTMATRGNKL